MDITVAMVTVQYVARSIIVTLLALLLSVFEHLHSLGPTPITARVIAGPVSICVIVILQQF